MTTVMRDIERIVTIRSITASQIGSRIKPEDSRIFLELRFTNPLAIQIIRTLSAPESKNSNKDTHQQLQYFCHMIFVN